MPRPGKSKPKPTLRELAARYREAAALWEAHFVETGEWDPDLERAMDKANRAYQKGISDTTREEAEDED